MAWSVSIVSGAFAAAFGLFLGDRVRGREVLGIAIAAGYVVQLLPECTDPPLAIMYERLRNDFADLGPVLTTHAGDPATLMSEILYGMPYTQTQEHELSYRCGCSSERVLASLATVGKPDLEDMMRSSEPLRRTTGRRWPSDEGS